MPRLGDAHSIFRRLFARIGRVLWICGFVRRCGRQAHLVTSWFTGRSALSRRLARKLPAPSAPSATPFPRAGIVRCRLLAAPATWRFVINKRLGRRGGCGGEVRDVDRNLARLCILARVLVGVLRTTLLACRLGRAASLAPELGHVWRRHGRGNDGRPVERHAGVLCLERALHVVAEWLSSDPDPWRCPIPIEHLRPAGFPPTSRRVHQVYVLVAPLVAGKSDRGHSGYLRFCGRAAFFAGACLRRAAGAFADREAGARFPVVRFADARLAGAFARAADLCFAGPLLAAAFGTFDAPAAGLFVEDEREAADRLGTASSDTASLDR